MKASYCPFCKGLSLWAVFVQPEVINDQFYLRSSNCLKRIACFQFIITALNLNPRHFVWKTNIASTRGHQWKFVGLRNEILGIWCLQFWIQNPSQLKSWILKLKLNPKMNLNLKTLITAAFQISGPLHSLGINWCPKNNSHFNVGYLQQHQNIRSVSRNSCSTFI